MDEGPIVVAYDGSPGVERALRDGGRLLSGRRALVLVVWKEGLGFETIALPAATVGLPPAAIKEVGLEAEPLEVASEWQRGELPETFPHGV